MPENTQIVSEKPLQNLLCAAFLLSGIITVLVGQILPVLSERFSLNDADASYFFSAQFSGSLAGTFLSKFLIKKFGFKTSTVIGLAAMAGGIFGINTESYEVCLAAFFAAGIGIGITLPTINMQIVELNPHNITSALNLLNFFWGVGAIVCKPFIDLTVRQTNTTIPTLILDFLLVLTAAAIALTANKNRIATENDSSAFSARDEEKVPIWTTTTAWLFALFGFVHVGFESGIGGWITTYSERLSGTSSGDSPVSPTLCYFLFFVIGRGISPLFSQRLSDSLLIFTCLWVILIGVSVLLFANSLTALMIGASIAGFGTSAVFPTNISRFTKTFGKTATVRATPVFIGGTLGAMAATSLIGFISAGYNNLRSGMSVLAAACVLLLIIQALIHFRLKD